MKDEMKIKFQATLDFNGSLKEFQDLQSSLEKLQGKGLMIGTIPIPEDSSEGLMIDTVPLPELEAGGLMIGTWPTPERNASILEIKAIPPIDRPRLAGIPAIVKLLGTEQIKKVTTDMPRFRPIEGINGGIRTAHLHLDEEVVLLNKDLFRDIVSKVATKLGEDLR